MWAHLRAGLENYLNTNRQEAQRVCSVLFWSCHAGTDCSVYKAAFDQSTDRMFEAEQAR